MNICITDPDGMIHTDSSEIYKNSPKIFTRKLNDCITFTKTKEIVDNKKIYTLKYIITINKKNITSMMHTRIILEDNDMLCLVPYDYKFPEELDEEDLKIDDKRVTAHTYDSLTKLRTGEDYILKMKKNIEMNKDIYYICINSNLHSTLLNLLCEYKLRLQKHKIKGTKYDGMSLFEFYFKDNPKFIIKGIIKTKNCWFIEI